MESQVLYWGCEKYNFSFAFNNKTDHFTTYSMIVLNVRIVGYEFSWTREFSVSKDEIAQNVGIKVYT